MKSKRHLFFCPELCTGCCLCELICSHVNIGVYNTDHSTIHVLSHPDLGSNLVSMRRKPCICSNGAEACAEMCNVTAILFVDEKDVPVMLKGKKWMAAPIFE